MKHIKYNTLRSVQLHAKTEKELREILDKLFSSSAVTVEDITDTNYSVIGEVFYIEVLIRTLFKRENEFLKKVGIDRSNILFI